MAHLLIIVSRTRPAQHTYLQHIFGGTTGDVIVDRRTVEALRFRQVNVTEAFTLQDAAGGFFRASLLSCWAEGGEALVYEAMSHSPESPLCLSLFCAVLARQRMLQVIQKATELGVTRVQPVFSERSVGRWLTARRSSIPRWAGTRRVT